MDRVRRIAQVESRNFRPSRAQVKIAFIWRCVDRDMAVTTEQLSTTGAFLSGNPDLFPEGPLDLTLSERGLFSAHARVVLDDGVAAFRQGDADPNRPGARSM